jgi:hypothetical protein
MLTQPIINYLIIKVPTLAGLEVLLAAAVHHLVAEMLRGLAHLHAGLEKTRVRSFSRPEKLPLKIHTGSSRAIYSYWVEKALLFPNWSSFSRQLPSPYVSNFRRFSLNPEGGEGEGGMDGRYLFTTGRAGTSRKEEWVRRRTGTAGSS